MNAFGILLAAGQGLRLRAGKPKALIPYDGRSMVERSFDAMEKAGCLSEIVVAVPPSELESDEVNALRNRGALICAGGRTRKDSVSLCLQFIVSKLKGASLNNYFVLIHDAARCLASPKLFEKTFEAVRDKAAVTTGMPSTDSLKKVNNDGMVISSLDRSEIWCVQTPQAFRLDLIKKAHDEFIGDATDDASMVEPFFGVTMIEGEVSNIKITRPEDLTLLSNAESVHTPR